MRLLELLSIRGKLTMAYWLGFLFREAPCVYSFDWGVTRRRFVDGRMAFEWEYRRGDVSFLMLPMTEFLVDGYFRRDVESP